MKKGKGITENRVNMGAFDFDIIIIVGDYKTTLAYVSWKFEDKKTNLADSDMGDIPRGKCFFRRGYVPVVWIPRKPQNSREYATYAHECLHAVFHLFEWANLPLTRDTEEVMTHAMAHLITNGLKSNSSTVSIIFCNSLVNKLGGGIK
ncbi:hypothetical protein [Candidatus Oleimmundimicrobium sp.]|uniref:hypothetical protein n=1 Tax=Candidatus Oleimmundimicrobium sp. TaxID=3060597 RepID=UPI00271CB2A3|nr:hypothetical protein [Candidatus Oleimmundimicrobium sp.]MDO8885756.1 hypothetical protein [Candidatus Oleimmundimicrobium sp.]